MSFRTLVLLSFLGACTGDEAPAPGAPAGAPTAGPGPGPAPTAPAGEAAPADPNAPVTPGAPGGGDPTAPQPSALSALASGETSELTVVLEGGASATVDFVEVVGTEGAKAPHVVAREQLSAASTVLKVPKSHSSDLYVLAMGEGGKSALAGPLKLGAPETVTLKLATGEIKNVPWSSDGPGSPDKPVLTPTGEAPAGGAPPAGGAAPAGGGAPAPG